MFPRCLIMCFMALWTMFSVTSGQTGVCIVPDNSIPAHISQMQGTWYLQLVATFDDATPITIAPSVCHRVDIVVTSKNTAVTVGSSFDKPNGQFRHAYSELTQLNDLVVRYAPFNQPYTGWYDSYPLMLNEDVLVASICQYGNSKPVKQYAQIITRTQTVDRQYLENILTETKVKYTNKKFFNNPPYCYSDIQNCPKTCKSD